MRKLVSLSASLLTHMLSKHNYDITKSTAGRAEGQKEIHMQINASFHPQLCHPEILTKKHVTFAFHKNQQDGKPSKQALLYLSSSGSPSMFPLYN